MINWPTIEDALRAWVVAGSGLPASQVIWARQNSERPRGCYIALHVRTVRQIGMDWVQMDGTTARARGVREAVLSVQCFAGQSDGAGSPEAILDRVIAFAVMPSVASALDVAGVGLTTLGPVGALDGVVGSTRVEPRAFMEARFMLASELTETSNFIEFVEVENLDAEESTYVPEDPL